MHAIENMHANEAALTAPVLSNDLDTQPTALLNAPSMVENWRAMIKVKFIPCNYSTGSLRKMLCFLKYFKKLIF